MGTRYITKFDPIPPKTEGKDMGTESHPPDGIPDPSVRPEARPPFVCVICERPTASIDGCLPKGWVGLTWRDPAFRDELQRNVCATCAKRIKFTLMKPENSLAKGFAPPEDGGSEVLPQAGPETKNTHLGKLAEMIDTWTASSTPSRSRILPRQDDELPSIWDLYMAAALGKLAEKFPAGWTLQERQACIAAVNQWAAEYAADAILERKKRKPPLS